jgi:arylsulfatase A-like enzyme
MAEGTAGVRQREGSGLIERLLVFGAAGAVVGLVVWLREVWIHGYAELGFWYSVLRSFAVSLTTGAASGAFAAITFGAVVDNVAASSAKWSERLSGTGWIRFCREPRLRRERWILIGFATSAFLLLRRWDENAWAPDALGWGAAIAVVLGLGVFLSGRLQGRGAGLGSASALTVLYGWAFAFGDSYGRADLQAGDVGSLVGALVAAGLVFGVVSAVDAGMGVRARLWIGVPLTLTVAAWPLHWLVGPTQEARNPRSVVLIGVDTLRFDRTRPDAGAPPLMRRLARFGEGGAVFTEATSQAPWTLPSFASIMTGRYPHEHGALSLQGLLRPREVTLAERLREAGYQTGAVVSHVYVDARRGFDQGFDRFDMSQVRSEADVTGEDVTDAALAWLEARGDGPFFLFVHYFDPHYEYRDHADFHRADGYRGGLDVRHVGIQELRDRIPDLSPADVDHLRDLYDEEVLYTDRAIARLLDALPPEAAVVVVADHGEELLERGWLGHTVSLHQEVIRVPLVMRLPGVTHAGQRIDAPVETRSLFATLLDYLGLPGGAGSLVPLLEGGGGGRGDVFSGVWLPDAPEDSGKRVRRSMVRRGSWKLIRDHDRGTDTLYDLALDPGEARDASADAPAVRDDLAAELDRWVSRMRAAGGAIPTRDISDAERERLKALGYL